MKFQSCFPVAKIDAELPRMTEMEILCLSQWVSLLSCVQLVIRFPSSDMNQELDSPSTPVVSTATGSNRYVDRRLLYVIRFRASAFVAADPGVRADSPNAVLLKVSVQVVSQHRLLPSEKGITVRPSGRLPSPLSRPNN